MSESSVHKKDDDVHTILARISSMETAHSGLTHDVHNLSRTLEGFAKETRDSIKDLSAKMADGGKTSWATLASWAAVIIAIVTLGMSGFVRDIVRTEESVHELQRHLLEHMLDGHPKSMDYKLEMLEKQLEKVSKP